MNQTNLCRFEKCIEKARRGEELTMGFFGGSITQGSLASSQKATYAYRVVEWWKEKFPQTTFHYVNAGIGGTTSHFGTARVVEDLLMYQPDLVIVDFSVNDEPSDFYQETMEGVLRRLLFWQSRPAILLLGNVYYDSGKTAQVFHKALADYYHIPYISIKDTIYQKIQDGTIKKEDITSDDLHPNDYGHELVANEIISFLDKVEKMEVNHSIEETIPDAVTDNAYELATRLTIANVNPMLSGFLADSEEKMGHLDLFKNGWIGKTPGDKIEFEVTAACIGVQYRKTIHKPARKARVILDGNLSGALLLDGAFEETWGECLYLTPILHHGETKQHVVEIEVLEDEEADATPFYLVSIIIS